VSDSAGRFCNMVVIALTTALLLVSSAAATTYRLHADGTGDFPTIQAAVDSVVNGDVIELYPGTYSGSGNVNVDYLGKAITIKSRFGIAEDVVIKCDWPPFSENRGFLFQSGEGLGSVLQAVTIHGGKASEIGGQDWGGGILCANGSSPTIRRCVIEDCSSGDCGGGVAAPYHDPINAPWIEDCTFRSNTAARGGGLATFGGSHPTIIGCLFEGNYASNIGGGVLTGTASISECLFLRNEAGNHGGGYYGYGTLEHCLIAENVAGARGGGVLADDGPVILNCTISGNGVTSGSEGAGIHVYESAVIENTVVTFNLGGPAVVCDASDTVTITCSDVYGNSGGDYVGCIAGQNGVNGNICANPIFCDIGNDDYTLGSPSPCLPANNTCGIQIGAYGEGCTGVGVPKVLQVTPTVFAMSAPAPNPFAASSTVRFGLPKACRVRLSVHDVAGRRVVMLLDQALDPGWYEGTWSGRNDVGRKAASGIYFVRLEAGDFAAVRKVMRLR
jgi:hypothetical protein